MTTTLILMVILQAAGLISLAMWAWGRINELGEDVERFRVRNVDLGREVQKLRKAHLPPINRPVVRWHDQLEARIRAHTS
jgi:hypothetical protein